MNAEQEKLAAEIIELHKINGGSINSDTLFGSIKTTNVRNIVNIIDSLIELQLMEYQGTNNYFTRLTEKGWHFKSFKEDREERQHPLTLAKWQVKTYWYWFILAVVGAVTGTVSLLLQLIK